MKRLRTYLSMLLVFACMICVFLPGKVSASTGTVYLDDTISLLSEKEAEEISSLLEKYSNESGSDIVIVTTNTPATRSEDKTYVEDYFDAHYDAGRLKADATILLIDMNTRFVVIQGYGSNEQLINDDNIEYILDAVSPSLSSGDYYKACKEFAKGVKFYLGSPSYEYGHRPIYYNIFFQAAIALIIGACSVGVMAYQSGGTMTTNNRTYLDESHSGVVAHRDIYIRTSVSKVRKPQSNGGGSSGGRSSGGGGVSSGGHSHSGGGRGF
ncbi:MAG: hypothetical protein E7256_07165 [Lachnospiraceae bacterium]|nr:hypothetical protein [Lachnospiraceae bacterium]